MFTDELIDLANQVLDQGYYSESDAYWGLCFHFRCGLENLDGYHQWTDIFGNRFPYSVFNFYQYIRGETGSYLGTLGILTPERVDFLNWIVNDFPNLQTEFLQYAQPHLYGAMT